MLANNEANQVICPHMAIEDDPTTSLAYPSSMNLCFHARPVVSPNLTHQNL